MKKKLVAVLMTGILGVGMLSGCGSSSSKTTKEDSKSSDGKVEITFWDNFAARTDVAYVCPKGHRTILPFAEGAEFPDEWECRCGALIEIKLSKLHLKRDDRERFF